MAETPKSPPTQVYTVFVVSDHSQAVRKFHLPREWLRKAAWIGGGTALLGLAMLVHYFSLLGAASENRVLREENAQLRSQILLVQEKVAHVSSTLDRVERFDAKLRTAVTQLQDPEKSLAVGPLAPPPAPPPGAPAAAQGSPAALAGTADALQSEAALQESAQAELAAYLGDRPSIMPSMPSIWPTRGWITSEFGVRVDPNSGERMMHRGLDIAAPYGAPVVAPASGTVLSAEVEGSLGKVLVIDHGFGVKTRYGHLSEFAVAPGAVVTRGERIGTVGNTGRSTGPHLHYEVRVDGVPENPRGFLFE